VVGGGAAGVCSAYELAQRGHEVLLLERDALCAGSSYGNAAFLAPSRSLPLAAPGVIRKSLRWMVEPQGAFRLRPRPDRELARWLLLFRRSCSDEVARHAALVIRDLTRESLGLFESYATRLDFGLRRNGLLELFRSEDGQTAVRGDARRLSAIGVETLLLDLSGARDLVPALDDSVGGALFSAEDAHLDPPAFVRELGRAAAEDGVRIETGIEVTRLERRGSSIGAVETSQGTVTAETVVLANGAWAARTGRALGLRFMIEPAKGYSFRLVGLDGSRPELPLIMIETRTTLTPIGSDARVTGKLDLVGFDTAARGRRVTAIPETIRPYLRVPAGVHVVETWSGFRPLTPDGLPLVGRAPGLANLVLAIGGGRMGLATAPSMGRMAAQVVDGDESHPSLPALDPGRFSDRSAVAARKQLDDQP
jgi:D-amino-acid dehydrogenase